MKFRRFFSIPRFFSGPENNSRIPIFGGNLRMHQYRGFEPPRRSRSQHSNPGGARCLSSASVAQMLAAARIKDMDALFGLVARNDAEWSTSFIFIVTKLCLAYNHGPKCGYNACKCSYKKATLLQLSRNTISSICVLRTYKSI